MKVIRKFLGQFSESGFASSSFFGGREDSRLAELDAQLSTRRVVLRMAVRDTLRHCGIPAGWITSHTSVVTGRDGERLVHLRLVVTQWHDELPKYMPLFQSRLESEIAVYDRDASAWLRSVSWQFDTPGYPHRVMPAPATWAEPPPARPESFDYAADALVVHEFQGASTEAGRKLLAEWMAASGSHHKGVDSAMPFADFAPTRPIDYQ